VGHVVRVEPERTGDHAEHRGIDITGETGPVQRFRQLISTMATVVPGSGP
jgi:hypothetical protein